MKTSRFHPVYTALCVLALAAMACGAVAAPTPVPTTPPLPTATATLVPPSPTLKPTATPRPTSTPDLAATKQVESWQADLQQFTEPGYLDNSAGDFKGYKDFSEEWAQINWYKWWPFEKIESDFMFGAHYKWSTSSSTPDESGCGIVFGVQPNEDHYAVVLDRGRILFLMARGSHVYEVGKTSGSGRVNFGNPAEADFLLLVQGQKAYVLVDGKATSYTLSADQVSTGAMAYTVLSGTNRGYGTRCEISNIHIWTPSD